MIYNRVAIAETDGYSVIIVTNFQLSSKVCKRIARTPIKQ